MARLNHFAWPLILVIGSSIAIFYLYSLVFQGESLFSSPRGPWIDSGPPIWINWSTAEIMHGVLAAGQIPIWSDRIGIGVPLLADPHLSYFSPFSFALYILPNSYGWDVMVLMKVVSGLVFAYALALRLGMNAWLGAWVALAYGFSGHIFQYSHHFHTNTLVFAPLCLIAVLDVFERRYQRGIILAAFAMPLMIFGGGLLDVIELSILLVLISLGYLFLGGLGGNLGPFHRLGRMFAAGMIVVVAVAIAAIWIVPYIELREIAVPPRPNRSSAYYNNIWYLFGLFMKTSMAPGLEVSHWFMKHIQYLSIIALPGFFVGLYVMLSSRSRYQYVYLGFLILIVVQILKLYGFPPIQVINEIPVLQDIRFEKYTGLYTLGFCLISGYGYQSLVSEKIRGPIVVLMIATAIVLALIGGYVLVHGLKWDRSLTLYTLLALYPLLLMLLWLGRAGTIRGVRAGLVLLTTVVMLYQLSIDTDTRFDQRLELFQNDGAVAAALAVSDTKRFFPMDGSGPRTWSAEGLNDVRDVSVVHTSRFHRFFKQIVEKDKPCWHRFVLCSSRANLVYLQGLRWLGVDTLILLEDQLALLQENPDTAWEVSGRHDTLIFVKLLNVEPLVSVVTSADISYQKPNIKKLLGAMSLQNPPTFLEAVKAQKTAIDEPNVWWLEPYSREGIDSRIVVNSAQPGYLMLRQQYYPGWVASVSGEEAEIYRANYLFQAIPIPAGRSIVTLSYQPKSLLIGALLSLMAILILIALYRYVRPVYGYAQPRRFS